MPSRSSFGVGPVLGDPPQPRADDPADQRGEDELVGPVDGLADLLQVRARQRPADDEADAHHQPEGLQGQAEDVHLGLHASEGTRSGRAPRSSRGRRSGRAPRPACGGPRRCRPSPPARAGGPRWSPGGATTIRSAPSAAQRGVQAEQQLDARAVDVVRGPEVDDEAPGGVLVRRRPARRVSSCGRDGHVHVAERARDQRLREGVRVELQLVSHADRSPLRWWIVTVVPSGERSTATSPAIARMICIPRPRWGADGASSQRPWSRISIVARAVAGGAEADDDRGRVGLERMLDGVRRRFARPPAGRRRPRDDRRPRRRASGAAVRAAARATWPRPGAATRTARRRPRAGRARAPRRRRPGPVGQRADERARRASAIDPGCRPPPRASASSPTSIGSRAALDQAVGVERQRAPPAARRSSSSR